MQFIIPLAVALSLAERVNSANIFCCWSAHAVSVSTPRSASNCPSVVVEVDNQESKDDITVDGDICVCNESSEHNPTSIIEEKASDSDELVERPNVFESNTEARIDSVIIELSKKPSDDSVFSHLANAESKEDTPIPPSEAKEAQPDIELVIKPAETPEDKTETVTLMDKVKAEEQPISAVTEVKAEESAVAPIAESKEILVSALPITQTKEAEKKEESTRVTPRGEVLRRGRSQMQPERIKELWYFSFMRYFQPIFKEPPFFYDTQLAEIGSIRPSQLNNLTKFNRYFTLLSLEAFAYFRDYNFDLFQFLYPGLRNYPLTVEDMAGLMTFGLLYNFRADYSFVIHFESEIVRMRDKLCPTSRILNYFVEHECKSILHVDHAMRALFKLAMETNCVYTVEAFFTTNTMHFDNANLLLSIEASTHSDDLRIFNRIALRMNAFDKVKVMRHAAEHCAMRVFENLLAESDATIVKAVEHDMNIESLFVYLIQNMCHSKSILSFPVWSEEEWDAGLLAAVEVGNWRQFKAMVSSVWHPFASFDSNQLAALRIIYSDSPKATEDFVVRFTAPDAEKIVFADLLETIMKLDCPEPVPVSIFKWILTEREIRFNAPHFDHFDPLVNALFMNSHSYLESIFTLGSKVIPALVTKREQVGNMGLWEWIKGANEYSNLMQIIIGSPSYHLLHAIANPNLLPSNWYQVFAKFSVDFKKVYKKSLAHLTSEYALDEEIITPHDRAALEIASQKDWTLLHLAVVTLNVRAVDALLSQGMTIDVPLSSSDPRTPLVLAQRILHLLNQPDYLAHHPMPKAVEKTNLRNEKRRKFRNFYAQKQDPTSAIYLRNRAIHNCEVIIQKLLDVQEGVVRALPKSAAHAAGEEYSEDEGEDYDL